MSTLVGKIVRLDHTDIPPIQAIKKMYEVAATLRDKDYKVHMLDRGAGSCLFQTAGGASIIAGSPRANSSAATINSMNFACPSASCASSTENAENAQFLRTSRGEKGPPFPRCRGLPVTLRANAGTPRAPQELYRFVSRSPLAAAVTRGRGAAGVVTGRASIDPTRYPMDLW